MIETAPIPQPISRSLHRAGLPAAFGCARWRSLTLSLGALLFMAGCATKEYTYNTVVSGGEQLHFSIVGGRPAPATADGIKILEAGLRPDAQLKKVLYGFHFSDTGGHSLQSVRVEDVSETEAVLLLEDLQPKMVDHQWNGTTRLFEADDPALKWVFYVNDSVRVYRFSITFADGRKLILNQAAMVPGWVKMTIRHMFGEKY
jgi:hypothetical protein